MLAYQNPDHPGNATTHHTGKRCYTGCGRPAGTAWSPFFCFGCNVRRMDRITEQLRSLAEQAEAMVQAS